MRFQSTILGLLVGGLILVSCEKKSVYKGGDPQDTQPNDFSFSTKKTTDIQISYDVPQGYRVHFEAYYSNPLSLNEDKSYVKNTSLIPFLTGYTDENGKFSLSVETPAYAENIYVFSDNAGVPALLTGKIRNSSAQIAEAASLPNKVITKGTSGSNYRQWQEFSYTLQKPELEKNKIEINDKLLATINKTLPTESSVVTSYFYEKITLKEDANVTLYFVSNGLSERQNALAYYVIPEGETYDQATVNQKLTLAFANLKKTEAGDGVKLVNCEDNNSDLFKKGTTIAFALLVDASQESGMKSPTHIAYSEKKFNSYTVIYDKETTGSTITRNVPHMGAFTTKDGQVILSFEDQPYHEKYSQGADFRDEVFILEANPVSSLPDDIPSGNDPDEDEPSYDSQYTTSGILSFEDNWPRKGDYDMNDVMLAYTRSLNYKASFPDLYVVSIDEEYTFLNNGADYFNSFGYQVGGNIRKNDIKAITITSDYKSQHQGLDQDLEKATIMLFDNGKAIPATTTFKVHIVLNSPVDYSSFYLYPFNPFIVVNGFTLDGYMNSGRTEVHLPQTFAPTDKADKSQFGTEDDKSANGKYYVATGKYPFAIELMLEPSAIQDFKIPAESQSIDVTYPRFINWVKSDGKEDKDWYINK